MQWGERGATRKGGTEAFGLENHKKVPWEKKFPP